MAAMTKVAPTPQQQRLWDETIAALTWTCPAFTHIAYSLLDTDGGNFTAIFTEDVPVAATDGKSVFINPGNYFKMKLGRRVFVFGHEIMHVILEHMVLSHRCQVTGKVAYPDGTHLPYDHTTMNRAMDYVINDLLITSKVGEFPSDGEFKGLWDKNIATGNDDVFEAYRKIYKQQPPKGGGGGGGKGNDHGGGFCEHKAPGSGTGKNPTDVVSQHNSQHVQTAVAGAMQAAKLMGKLPAGLERLLGDVLDPKVDWRDHIRALMARKLGSGGYDWRRPDRRLIVRDIFAPSRSGYGTECVVVGVDTSGSIGDAELAMFFAEMGGILEGVKPRALHVVWCDAKVHRVDTLEDASELYALKKKGAPGGGGTSFVPVFEEIEKRGWKPDTLVYLTDGMGTFPQQAPRYPVVWGNIYPDSKYPFGDVVEVPKQA